MFKIKTYNKISDRGLGLFDKENYKVADNIENPDAIILRSHKLDADSLNDDVCCIARAGAGVNNIPVDKCSDMGIVVFNTPGANANGVKELVLCGLFMASRDVSGALEFSASIDNSADDVSKLVEGNKSKFKGPEIKGKTLGIIGLGAIGAMVANAASELGMDVLGFDPFISVDSAWGLSRKVNKAGSADEILRNSDYISIHVPLLDSTRGMIGEDAISKMKDGTRILNFSRGGLVDEKAVLDGIEKGRIERYVTDFPSSGLLNNSKVVCIPHLGASTYESEINCAVMGAKQIKDFIETGNIINSVNFPNCTMEQNSPLRLAITYRNVPNMLSQISSVVANCGINIDDMLNKGRGDYAYTLIDISDDINDSTLNDIRSIKGVLKARIIRK